MHERDRSVAAQITAHNLMEIAATIAKWRRLSGSEDELAAFSYIDQVLSQDGIDTELMTHDAYISIPIAASLTTADGRMFSCIAHSFSSSTSPTGVQGTLIDARGVSPGDRILNGRIALLDGLAVASTARELEGAGAIGQIYVHDDRAREGIVSTIWGSPGLRLLRELPSTPLVSVNMNTGLAIRQLLATERDLVWRITTEVDTTWRRTPVLIATVRGQTDDFVLFSGHVDSWHYGAMDNAAGNAAMVEIGRTLQRNRHALVRSLRLAFWSGHSHGRYSGSSWYADQYALDLHRRCVAHVNVDSIGGAGASVLSRGVATAALRAVGAAAVRSIAGVDYVGGRVTRGGDQSFLGLGIPALWISLSEQPDVGKPDGAKPITNLGWWWHTPEDTISRLSPKFLERDARIYAAAISNILSSPLLPISATAEVIEVHECLTELSKRVGNSFDLSVLTDRSARLVDLCGELEGWVTSDGGHQLGVGERDVYNNAVRLVLRALIPISYTRGDTFSPDPAVPEPPVPALKLIDHLSELDSHSNEAKFLRVDLVRARSRVMFALETATEVAEYALGRIAPGSTTQP